MRNAFAALLFLAACPSAPARTPPLTCSEGAVVIEGACVSYRVAAAFCGKGAKPSPSGGCARIACAPGEALDVDHGLCLPESTVFLGLNHMPARYDDPKRRAACAYGSLTSHAAAYSCAMGKLSCQRGERWVKTPQDAGVSELAGKCEAEPPCAGGELYDEVSGACAKVVRNRQVDMGAWARLALGTDTAEGTNAFCAPIRATGGRARFQIDITVPDNDVTRATARLVARGLTPSNAIDAAVHSLAELVETLHFYGQSAPEPTTAASVTLEVSCSPPVTAPPTLELRAEDGGA